MARELSDVLHHMVPEAGGAAREEPPAPRTPAGRTASRCGPRDRAARVDPPAAPAAAPRTLAVPVGERDRLRGALLWNLAAEIERRWGRATLLAPAGSAAASVWSGSGAVLAFADGPEALGCAAARLNAARVEVGTGVRAGAPRGMVLASVPRGWVREQAGCQPLFAWTLLLTSPAERDLLDACAAAEVLLAGGDSTRVGVTLYGARSLDEARDAFCSLASATDRCPGGPVRSYGLLAGEAEMERAAGARRPVSDSAPRSLAARSLADVAGWILGDAPEAAGA